MHRMVFCLLCLVGFFSAATCWAADSQADYPKQLTDLAGHQVMLTAPPARLFLTQPRQLYALASLLDDPVMRLAGWAYPLAVFDPAMAQRFTTQWPALEQIAQWLYPERFHDLDPATTFDALLPTTLSLSREGQFWGEITATLPGSSLPDTRR